MSDVRGEKGGLIGLEVLNVSNVFVAFCFVIMAWIIEKCKKILNQQKKQRYWLVSIRICSL